MIVLAANKFIDLVQRHVVDGLALAFGRKWGIG